jgi:hypothetical protein
MSTPLDPSVNKDLSQFIAAPATAQPFGPGYGSMTTPLTGNVVSGTADPWNQQAPFGASAPVVQGHTLQPGGAQHLVNQFYNFTTAQKNQLRTQLSLINSNYLTAPDTDATGGQSLLAAWTGLVGTAQQYNANGTMVSPWDVLAKDVSAVNAGGGNGTDKSKVVNRTVSQVNLTNRVDAQAIFYQSAQQLLGRAPTDSEVASFQGFLNDKEKANPVVSNIRTTYDSTGQVVGSDTTKSSGGVSADAQSMLAMQQAEKNPEYGAYQAATTYMNALKAAIGGS